MTDQTVVTILLAVITALMGWVGFSITAILRGWMIPAKTHALQIQLLTDRIAAEVEEKNVWRGTTDIERRAAQETRAQLNMSLEANKAFTYSVDQMRIGLERIGKDGTQ